MSKSVSMADIAREAGVSKTTVSLALRSNPRIPEETRREILAVAQRLDYHTDPEMTRLMDRIRSRRGGAECWRAGIGVQRSEGNTGGGGEF